MTPVAHSSVTVAWARASKPLVRFSLSNAGASELEAASHSFEHQVSCPLSPRQAFDYVAEIKNDAQWFPDFVDADWETAVPHGVGSTRWFRSKLLWLRERIVIWNPGEQFAFIGLQTTLPLVRRFAEDYRFTPTATGGCVITWRILYSPRPIFRPLHPILRPLFAKMFTEAARALEAALSHEAQAPAELRASA